MLALAKHLHGKLLAGRTNLCSELSCVHLHALIRFGLTDISVSDELRLPHGKAGLLNAIPYITHLYDTNYCEILQDGG
jgi:hypothetical protein